MVPGGKANTASSSASPSADGRYVAFSTQANNLVAEDTNNDDDVYVRDTVLGTTTLITPGDGPNDASGFEPSVSDDGQRVAFTSFDDLTPDDTNNQRDVYVYDFGPNPDETILVSRPTGTGPAAPAGTRGAPVISGDGTSVAFASADNTLDPANDDDSSTQAFLAQDVFVRDLDDLDPNDGTTELVSRNSTVDGDLASWRPSINQDGTRVSFDSQATNLDAADPDECPPPPAQCLGKDLDVYVRDRTGAGNLVFVSRADTAAGANANDQSVSSALSADGNEVAFASTATNLDAADTDANFDIYVRDIGANDTELISRATGASGTKADQIAQSPTISADGTAVAFISSAGNLDPQATPGTNQAYVRDRVSDTTRLESRADGPSGEVADDGIGEPAISSDGSAVAFITRATNLDPADTDTAPDLIQDAYVRDMASSETELVSQSPVEPPVNANAESRDPAISADGRYVAFTSSATNIDPAATNNRSDIFVRDTTTGGVTVLASREDGEDGAEGDGSSTHPAISADGRYVAFESETAFAGIDGDTETDIYVRDLIAHTTTLVSLDDGDANVANFAEEPSISGDGMRIAFETDGIYHPDDGNGFDDVYVRDLAAGETLLVSRPDGSTGDADEGSHLADLSADGSAVAFESKADNLTADLDFAEQQAFVRRIDADQTILASRADGAGGAPGNAEAREPTISGDGSVVAFQSDSDNLDPDKSGTTTAIFVRDLDALDTDVASRATNGDVANGTSTEADLSNDGTYIAFESSAPNLYATAPGNAQPDVFQRDLAAGVTVLASRASTIAGVEGDEGNDTSGDPSISEHGRLVAFESAASNLDSADTDPTGDIYLRDVLGADTVPPVTTIATGPADGSLQNTNTFDFTFTVDEPGSSSECRLDGGAFGPCSGSFATGVLGDGQHTFEVRSTDRVGNVETPAASRTFTVDTVPPDTSFVDPGQSATSDSTPSFTFSSTEGGGVFECSVDGAAFVPCDSGAAIGPLADGDHDFAVRAFDTAGNVDPSPAQRSFTVDTVAPDTSLTGGPQGPTADSTPSFSFSSSEPGSTFLCATDGGAFDPCVSGLTVGPLADGAHTVSVGAVDAAGNLDPSPAQGSFTVDTVVSGLDVSAKAKQEQTGKRVKVVAEVVVDEAVTATLTGEVKQPGKDLELLKVTKELASGQTKKLTGELKKSQREDVLDRLERGKKVTAKLTVEATDTLGNSTTVTDKVKLKK